MNVQDWLALLAILVCLALSFFFSGSETALAALSRSRMSRLEKAGNVNARIVNRLLNESGRLIGGLLVARSIVNVVAISLAAAMMMSWFGRAGGVYAIVLMAMLIMVFAEILPRALAAHTPERAALLVARPVHVVVHALSP